jgi:hypothetical protein
VHGGGRFRRHRARTSSAYRAGASIAGAQLRPPCARQSSSWRCSNMALASQIPPPTTTMTKNSKSALAIRRSRAVYTYFSCRGCSGSSMFRMVASEWARRNSGCSGSIMSVSLPGLTRQSIRFAKFFEMMDPRVKPAGDPCGDCTTHPAMVSFTTLTSCLSVNGLARKLN